MRDPQLVYEAVSAYGRAIALSHGDLSARQNLRRLQGLAPDPTGPEASEYEPIVFRAP
jgi:hypothetical protein